LPPRSDDQKYGDECISFPQTVALTRLPLQSGTGARRAVLSIWERISAIAATPIVFFELRKAHWDRKITQLCQSDGGVTVFERVRISPAQRALLGSVDQKIAIPIKELAPPDAAVYSQLKTTHLRVADPEVWRDEVSVIRAADQKTIARWVVYSRLGGDFPTFAHPSRHACPDLEQITSEVQRVFLLEGSAK
jgi:hypothetical protein